MTFRKILFWCHLGVGCTAGLVILIMSVTGVMLTYERQIVSRIEHGEFAIAVQAGAALLPEEILAKLEKQGTRISPNATLVFRSRRDEPVELVTGREAAVYIDPYSGQVLGRPSQQARGFFRQVVVWHRWLGQANGSRVWPKIATGVSNLVFLGILVSGFYLWIPKKWTVQHLRPITWFRSGLSGKARDFNWHNVFGVWALAPLFLIVLCAVPMSFGWASDLIYQITGNQAPVPIRGNDSAGAQRRLAPQEGLNRLFTRAEAQQPGWRSISIRMADETSGIAQFLIDSGNGGQPQLRSTISLDRANGSVVGWETFAGNNAGRRLRMWARFVHTGEAFGLLGQSLAGLATFAACMLVWTGISLALRRLRRWKSRKHADAVEGDSNSLHKEEPVVSNR